MDQPNYKFCSFLNNSQLQEVFSQNYSHSSSLSLCRYFCYIFQSLFKTTPSHFHICRSIKYFETKKCLFFSQRTILPLTSRRGRKKKRFPFPPLPQKHKANQNNPIPNMVSHRTQGLEQYFMLVFLLCVESNLVIYIIGKSI